jgi:hypothetical protein
VTGQELRQLHARRELDKEHPGEGEDQHEGVDLLALEGGDLGPVGLCLLARRGLEAHGHLGFAGALGFEGLEEEMYGVQRAGVALRLDLLEEAHAGEGTTLVALGEIGLVGVEYGPAVLGRLEGFGCPLAQHSADGVAPVPGQLDDRVNRVSLAMKLFDVHPLLQSDHEAASGSLSQSNRAANGRRDGRRRKRRSEQDGSSLASER